MAVIASISACIPRCDFRSQGISGWVHLLDVGLVLRILIQGDIDIDTSEYDYLYISVIFIL